MSFWDSISAGAKKAGDATKLAAYKTKLRTDILMTDREIQNAKRAFGVSMYDHVSPLSQSSDFYAATDDLTTILRPPLINAQKEIQALAAKRVKLKEALASAEALRAGAFPTKAETVGQKFMNFGKAGYMHSGETKIKTELALLDRQIKGYKQGFGLELFDVLASAEDERGYLPTDRQVRSIYDTTRGDITRMEAKKRSKGEELAQLGGTTIVSTDGNAHQQQQQSGSNLQDLTSDLTMQNSYFDDAPSASGSYSNPAPSAAGSYSNPTPSAAGSYSNPTPSGYSDSPSGNQQMEDLLL
jgi:hypothetical protein